MSHNNTPISMLRSYAGYVLPCLLFLVHIPFVVPELLRLWYREHYQFFPFALAAFGVLFYQRRLPSSFRWTWQGIALIVADLVLLAGGIFLNSSLLVYVGLILLMLAVCLATADAKFKRSLGYLILLPLITLRLPLNYDTQAIHWLQRATTSVASQLLNYFGFLHLRAGNVLEFPGKRFLVEEACSGVQSLFTVLFLAALIACGNRRKLFHTVFVLLSAACFAGVMNVLRVSAIAIAWSDIQMDLSSGWQHDTIGYLALICAAGLVYSTDAALAFFFSPVPALDSGIAAIYRNPFTCVWNWMFLSRPRLPIENSPATGRGSVGYAVNQSVTPGFFDLIRPRNLMGWAWGFIEGWFVSRPYRSCLLCIPTIVVGLGGLLFMSWLRNAPLDGLVRNYEQAAAHSLTENDPDQAGLFLKGLVQLRPLEKRYRFQLALHQLENEQTGEGVGNLQRLTGSDGFIPARLWLVNQAFSKEPVVPMTDEHVEAQLRAVLHGDPMNAMANRMLADIEIRRGQFKLAEGFLLKAAEVHPSINLPLAKVQQKLRQSDTSTQQCLTTAQGHFEARLMRNPEDELARTGLSETMFLQGKWTDAEQVLREGLALSNTPKLRQSLASIYSQLAARRLQESVLNRDLSRELITQAILLRPENYAYLNQALAIGDMGAAFDEQQLQPAIDSLIRMESPTTEQQVLLARALAAAGHTNDAIETAASVVESRPEVRLLLAKLLKSAGRHDEAQELTDDMLADYKANQDGANLSEICEHAGLLLTLKEPEAAISLLKDTPHSAAAAEQIARRNFLYGHACVSLFDQQAKANDLATHSERLRLLEEALQTKKVDMLVIDRLARLSCSTDDLAATAEQRLNKLLTTGNANSSVYNLIGSYALQTKETEKARRYLERAYSLDSKNPMVLNNLALAILRIEGTAESVASNRQRAMELANIALQIIPAHPDALSTRGEIFIAQERWEDARRDLEVALPHRQQSANVRRLLVQVFAALGDTDLAKEHQRILTTLSAGNDS